MSPQDQLTSKLRSQLDQLRVRIRQLRLTEGLALTCLTACLLLVLALTLDWFFELPIWFRTTLLWSWPSVILILAGKALWQYLTRSLKADQLAAVVESVHPEFQERLITLVEILNRPPQQSQSNTTSTLQRLLGEQTESLLLEKTISRSVNGFRSRVFAAISACFVVLVLVPFVLAPQAYGAMVTRFLQPWSDQDRPTNLILKLVNLPVILGRGDDLPIIVKPEFRYYSTTPPQFINLKWSDAGGQRQTRQLKWNQESEAYEFLIPRVLADLTISAVSETTRSTVHLIEVNNRPRLAQLSVSIIPPAYTGLAPETISPLIGDLTAFEHSQVRLDVTFSEPVSSAEILWLDGTGSLPAPKGLSVQQTGVRSVTPIQLSAVNSQQAGSHQGTNLSQTASVTFVPSPVAFSGRFAIRATNALNLTSNDEEIRWLHLNQDLPPVVRFTDRETVSEARPQDIFKVPLQAQDDFQLKQVELHIDWTKSSEQFQRVLPVSADQLSKPRLNHLFEIDLSEFGLSSGTSLNLKIRATDNREIPGPNETWSEPKTVRIRTDARAQGDQQLAEEQRQTIQELTQMQTAATEQKLAARALQQQIQSDKAPEKLEERKDQAAAIAEQIDQLNEKLEKFSASMEGQPLFEHLAQKAQDISEQSVSQAAASAAAAQNAESASEQQQHVNDAANKLQKAAKEIDDLQKEFQEVSQLQRDLLELNRIADQTEKLAIAVDGLAAKQELAASNAVAKQAWQTEHGQLVVKHRQIEDDLSILLEKHPDLMEKAKESLRHRLLEIAEQTEGLSRQYTSLASANRNDLNRRRKHLTEMKTQQELTQGDVVAERLKHILDLKPENEQIQNLQNLIQQARKSLDSGDLAIAEMSHREAANRLQTLIQQLRETPLEIAPDSASLLEESSQRHLAFAERISQARVALQAESIGDSADEIFSIFPMTEDLLQRSRRLTNSVRQLGLKNSQDVRKLIETVEQASLTRNSLQQLNFRHASESAVKTTEKNLELLELLQQTSSPRIPERMVELAEELLRDQQSATLQLQALAASPEQQDLYRFALQSDYQQTVAALADELSDIARDLNLTRIRLPKNAEAAQAAQTVAAQTDAQLRSSLSDQIAINHASSAKKLDDAAESLRQVSQHAKTAAEGTNQRAVVLSNIPGEVGRTVAQSSELLMQAGYHLAEMRAGVSVKTAEQQFFDDLKNLQLPPGTDEGKQPPDLGKQSSDKPGSGGTREQDGGNGPASEDGSNAADADAGTSAQDPSRDSSQTKEIAQSLTSSTLREAANGMRRAAEQIGVATQKEETQQEQQPGKETEQSNSDEAGSKAVDGELHLQNLNSGLSGAGKNWGRLPGKMQTEMLESSRKGRDPIYRGAIQRYFEEIARPRSTTETAPSNRSPAGR